MLMQAKNPDGELMFDPFGLPIYQESDLRVPETVATNLPYGNAGLPPAREDRPGQNCEFWRDVFRRHIIEPRDWAEWIKRGVGNRRRYCKRVLQQNGIGSCASEGITGCYESLSDMRGLPEVFLNPWPVYYEASGGRDVGSTLQANLKIMREVGGVPDVLWPRSQHRWNDVPPRDHAARKARKNLRIDEYYEVNNATEAVSALFADHAVYAAYPGHAWELVAPLNTVQGLFRNSWGEEWDDDGFGVIAYTDITFQYGIYAIETVIYRT